MPELNEQVAEIQMRADLVTFIEALQVDLKMRPEKWENPTLESFLDALAGWIADMDGYYQNTGQQVPESPTWKTFGEMLSAARVYE